MNKWLAAVPLIALFLVGSLASSCATRAKPDSSDAARSNDGSVVTNSVPPSADTQTVKFSLGDAVGFINGNIVIANRTEWVWTDVRMLLDASFTYSLPRIDPGQTVTVPAREFVQNIFLSYPPTARPWGIVVSCDLPDGRRGEFSGSWH